VSSPPSVSRHLDWRGCYNARDLGGLPLVGGGETRFGQLIRSDAVDPESPALVDHGVRTVIDLRNDDEREPGTPNLHIPLDAMEDREFWNVWENGWQFGTPLYYRPHLERHPERSAAVTRAIATAPPGGVVFHCGGGRDRAGQITMLVLLLADVEPEAIADDYVQSAERLRPKYLAHGEEDQTAAIERYLREGGTTLREVALEAVRAIDAERVLRRGGADDADFVAIRERLRP
jgi:protein-tyrosine phosphatase